jgi:hypothetical protein
MNTILDPADEQARNSAAGQQHAFVYIDEVLKAKTDGYLVQLTVGWSTPAESYAPVATFSMPAPFAKRLAEILMQAYEQASEKRRD